MRGLQRAFVRPAMILALLVPLFACSAPKIPGPFNVVLITLDTVRADHLASYGYSREPTPALDRFAAQGVRFDKAITATTFTTPSHGSILTGLHPAGHGAITNGWVLPLRNRTIAEILSDRGYRTGGFVAARWVLGRRFGFAQGFDVFLEGTEDQRRAGVVTQEALEFIEAAGDERFFTWIHYYDAHCGYEPPKPYDTRFIQGLEARFDPAGKCGKSFYNTVEMSESEIALIRGLYDGELSYLDSQLELLFARLEELGRLEDTLFIITADHGEALHDRGWTGHNLTLHEWEVRIPLWIRMPGLRSGSVDAVVSTTDLIPTILEVLKLPPLREVDGIGLLPLMQHPELPAAEGERAGRAVFARISPELAANDQAMIREGKWKLLIAASGAVGLFDLDADPGESTSLAAAQPELYTRLRSRLDQWLEEQEGRLESDQEISDEVKERLRSLGYVNQR